MLQLAVPFIALRPTLMVMYYVCLSLWPPLLLRPAPLWHYLGRSPNLWYNVGVAAAGL